MNILAWCLCIILGATVAYLNITGVLKDDSAIEEVAEEIIEHLINEDVDLSPLSEEQK